jgi:predicted acetyltransferase
MPDFSSYFDDSDRNHPYIVRVDNEIAGFILTRELETETRKYNYLAHFFILRKFRRSGIGRQAAKIIISSYRGEWELYQLENNIPAQKFWDNVIDDISNGQVTERLENGRRYQSFVCCINQK